MDKTAQNKKAYYYMVLGMFMAVLDIQIVASSINEIQSALSASADEISWIQTSYLIAEVIMIPICGWLCQVFSTRVMFSACAAIFTLSSFLCAFAWNLPSMVVFRVIQGFFGGALIPTVFSSIYFIFPPEERSKAMIISGVVTTLAPTLGPSLGGWITANLSWHWMFLMNIVPGVIMIRAVWTMLDIDRPNSSLLKRFDYVGVLLLAAGLGCLELLLKKGQKYDWFDSGFITLLFIIVTSSLIYLVYYELKRPDPIVDIKAFRNRNFSIGCLVSFATGVGLYGSVYLVPVMLASIRGYNSLQIGLVMFSMGFFMFASGPLAGFLEKKMDLRVMLAIGLGLFGLGMVMNGFMTSEVNGSALFWPQAVRGISIMLCFLPMTQVTFGTLPLGEIQNASGLYNLMRNLGGAIGIAVLDTQLRSLITFHTQMLEGGFTSDRLMLAIPEYAKGFTNMVTTDTHLQEKVWHQLLHMKASKQAITLAFNDLFMGVGIYLILCMLLTPLLKAVKHQGEMAGDH
jgi:DHA2 family multidrug resistance protein